MSLFVLDASVTLSWLLSGQATDDSIHLFNQVRDQGAIVPTIWSLEIANALARSERTGQMTRAEVDEALGLLSVLPIEFDNQSSSFTSVEVLSIMRVCGLKVYDTLYFELAQRKGLPLATFDLQMYRACQRAGIPVAVEIES